jgi:cephalosporin-C deacetylase
MFTDLPEEQLRTYRSTQREPDDFDEFWSRTLIASRSRGQPMMVVRAESPLTTVDVYDVSFPGFEGDPVRGWLRVPAGAVGPLPAVVQFVGYGGGRGAAVENLLWASAGFVHFQMDTRGQGSMWSAGDTPDLHGSGPQSPGFMTRGIESPESYYYRRLITDAVRAVDAVRDHPIVDPTRVSVLGFSQGGGLALAVSGLVPDINACFTFVPFLCDFPRAITFTDREPYREIGRYLAVHRERSDTVHMTLSYFDGVNFAARGRAPAYFSTALMDATCPPSTVFGAFNSYGGDKEIVVWPYNAHEGGGLQDELRAIDVMANKR